MVHEACADLADVTCLGVRQVGTIDSAFGKSGKFKVVFTGGVSALAPGDALIMEYRRYIHDTGRRMEQEGGVRGGASRRKGRK